VPDSNETAADAAPKPVRRLFNGRGLDLMIALGVLAISLISLFVAVSSNRTQERMLAASVWPSLQFGTSNVGTDGAPQLTFDLLNRGVGPARMRWSELSLAGKPVQTLNEFLLLCCDEKDGSLGYSSGLHRRVLGSDEWIHVVRIPREGLSEALWQKLDEKRQQVRLRACYCSVLDDCWLLDSDAGEPTAVATCPAAPAKLWSN